MGALLSAVSSRITYICNLAIDHPPIMYQRAQDFTPAGLPRRGIQDLWDLAMRSMITADLPTRRLLFPVIQTRIKNLEASQKYTQAKMEDLLVKFDKWDEQKIFDMHDLFQVFEVDGDGLIEIAEMCVGLDNLGDKTPMEERIAQLAKADEDQTGSIDFEEFLSVIYDLELAQGGSHSLAQTFRTVDANVRFIRHMSAIQQIQAGFL